MPQKNPPTSPDRMSSIPGTQPGDRGGRINLTPLQMRQVAFIHGITSVRCQCGDTDNCADCSATEMTRNLAAAHLGI